MTVRHAVRTVVLAAILASVATCCFAQATAGSKAKPPQRATPARDLVDLVDAGLVEVETAGDGIESVTLRVRKLASDAVAVRIPVGTFFVSSSGAAQNMVATRSQVVQLTTGAWRTVTVSAACANRPRDIPEEADRFSVSRSPSQAELTQLMPVLEKAGAPYVVRQAAVWIVTDDADYDDLGILVASATGFGGSRVINEAEAARAIKLCTEAGIDVTGKAIWRDRQEILDGLPAGLLKRWLAERQ